MQVNDGIEKSDLSHQDLNQELVPVKLDKHGLPLSPQPTPDPTDPLNWPLNLKCTGSVTVLPILLQFHSFINLNACPLFKIFVLAQVSLLGTLGTLNTSIINPAYVPMAKQLGISTITASYQTAMVIALNGIGPFIWIPLANVYGRRPVYLLSTTLGFASSLGSGFSKSFANLLVARVFNGFFPAAMSLGAGTVMDLFFLHQRGRAMGVFTVSFTTGAHIAPILGGLMGQYLGWQWCFFLAAIFDGFLLLVIIFCLPETLYIRTAESYKVSPSEDRLTRSAYLRRLAVFRKFPGRSLHLRQFFLPSLRMARYPSVLFPAIYHLNTLLIGLAYGGALVIGGIVGELMGGMVVDEIFKRERQKQGGEVEPETRLKAIWTGAFLVPLGLLMYGFGVQYRVHFMIPIVGTGIVTAGVQVIMTVAYVYAIDCYKSEASETAQFINLLRQEFGFTFAFYAIRLAEAIGYQFTFLLFVLIGSGVAFVPMVVLMFRGKGIRERAGEPKRLDLFGDAEGPNENLKLWR